MKDKLSAYSTERLPCGRERKRERVDDCLDCGSASVKDYMKSQLIIINMLNTFCSPLYILISKRGIYSLAAINKVR